MTSYYLAFLFLTGLLTHTLLASKEQNFTKHTALMPLSIDLYDNDNRPGSKPRPQGRIRYAALGVTPSRRQSLTAIGRPSFTFTLLAFLARTTCCQCAVPEKRQLAF